jgi:hypothetical protein
MRIRHCLLLLTLSLPLMALSTEWAKTPSAGTALDHGGHSAHASVTRRAANTAKPSGTSTGQIVTASLPVAVDGAQRPDLIPDSVAYYHFIMAAAVPSNPSTAHVSRRERILAHVGLSQGDHDAFLNALTNVREELDRIEADRKQWSFDTPSSRAALTVLKHQQTQVLDGARTRIQNALTSDGMTRLDSHVQQQVKRSIVIYGEAPK